MANLECESDLIQRLDREPKLKFTIADVDKVTNGVAEDIDWATKVSVLRPDKQVEFIEDRVFDANHELAWRSRYAGKIPARWSTFMGISADLEEAWLDGVDLPDIYKEAALTHHIFGVCEDICQTQKLRPDQFALVIVNPAVPAFSFPDMILNQRGKGVSLTEINEAYRLAEEIKKRKK